VFYPPHVCDPAEEVRVAVLRPVQVILVPDRDRDLISRQPLSWAWRPVSWDADPGDKDGLGGPAGFTLHGVEGWDRRRTGRAAESAIVAGLIWLARHQNMMGGWGTIHPSCPCDTERGEFGDEVTALVLRTFLAAGYSAASGTIYVDPGKPDQALSFGGVLQRASFGCDPSADVGPKMPVPVDDAPILRSQRTAESGCYNGSWDPTPAEGRVVITARNLLRLIALRKR
jgi:hypothetical protein